MMVPQIKSYFSRLLFNFENIGRLHIVGCPRSGTTMLHLSMMYFKNTILSHHETDIAYPFLRDRLEIVWQAKSLNGRVFYVTKRNSGWFTEENIRRLAAHTIDEQIGIINIVRDPRDVLTSHHALQEAGGPYVTPEHWLKNIEATDRVFQLLADYPNKITVRYEDMVRDSPRVEAAISGKFQLERRKGAYSFAMIKDNIERFGYRPSAELIGAVHQIRNADENSIGRWRNLELSIDHITTDLIIRSKLHSFCNRYGYQS